MDKEKQIEEIALDLNNIIHFKDNGLVARYATAEAMYNLNYRKQSEGEWETIPDYQPNKLIAYRHICSVCKTFYKDIRPHGHKYCHECGAKMKGGA